jgi:hypothetical protein
MHFEFGRFHVVSAGERGQAASCARDRAVSACQARSKIDPGKSSKNFKLASIVNCTIATNHHNNSNGARTNEPGRLCHQARGCSARY